MRRQGLPVGKGALKKRDVVSDPQSGDVLVRDGQKIEVTRREGETVYYIALAGKNCPSRALYQSVTGWQRWAGGFKVKSRGLTPGECPGSLGRCVSGPCSGCGKYVLQDAHILDLNIFHEECCPGRHEKARSNGRTKEAATR